MQYTPWGYYIIGMKKTKHRNPEEVKQLMARLNRIEGQVKGIKGMIGKGSRAPEVIESMKKHGVTYFAAVGGAAALISKSVKSYTVLAYPELGPEAVAALEVEDFPAIVVIDSEGNNFYEMGQAPYRKL